MQGQYINIIKETFAKGTSVVFIAAVEIFKRMNIEVGIKLKGVRMSILDLQMI